MCCGQISAKPILSQPLKNMPDGSGALAHGPADIAPKPVSTPWRDLRARTLSALVAGPIGLAVLWWGGWPWDGLIALMAVGLALEWRGLCRAIGLDAGRSVALGLLYFAPACLAFIWLRDDAVAGRGNVLFVVLTVWASDIGAYLSGRLFGGPKLAPRISPGKTWSGALGGVAGVLLIGLAASMLQPGGVAGRGYLVAVLLGIAAQAGDLLESAIKRRAGVKDSGRLMPGHGGLLDRMDGMLFAAPLAAIVALATGKGIWLWVGIALR
jgi:phosphatidate cytidylyltransferase